MCVRADRRVYDFLQAEGEMAERIAAFPWSAHPLGRIEDWPASLRTAVSLILNSRHPMWVGWGERMSFLYNDAYLHVLGLEKHPWALGRPAEEVWAEIWDVCGPLADNVFRQGEATFVDDVRLFMSRGDRLEETFYSFSYSPIRDEAGRVAGLFCPSNDVTAKVVGARRLRTLSELAANALVQRSTAGACASAAATLAKNPDDVPFALLYLVDGDRPVLQQRVGVPDGAPLEGRFAEVVATVLESGRTQRLGVSEAVVVPMAGRAETRPLGVLVAGVNPARPLDAEHDAFFELVASNIGSAITNARAAEEEQRRAEMLAEMDRAKTAFFSNVSHEFRTPLTLMLGPLDQLAKSDDERDRLLAQTARRNALRLLKLVNTLLEFSRLEAGRTDAAFAKTDLDRLTRDVASSFRSAIESAGLRFTVDAELDEPAFVDRSMWERILLNLLSNALKFTFAGEIRVSLRRDGEFAELRVTDTGVGIEPAELPQLFERFHRVRGARGRSHEGSGIGLALVRDLAELHGGTVDAESVVGAGSTFRVRIPLGDGHIDPARITHEDDEVYASAVEQYLAEVDATLARTGNTFVPEYAGGTPRARVLLADDNADLRAYVGGILAPRYAVTAVGNGRQALDAALAAEYDLIVSDVMMPEMDGFELLRAVRDDDRLARTPFIMLSARAGEEAAREGLLHGADDYIVKPFSADELLARVYAQINPAAIRERALRERTASEERFRTLAASLPYIVIEADPSGEITFLSDEYAAYSGQEMSSGFSRSWAHVIHPDDTVRASAEWKAALGAGVPYLGEFRMRRYDGVYRWFTARVLPQRGSDGAVLRWVGTVAEIHEQRQASREREFLLRASRLLAEPVDLASTLASLAQLTIPDIADWCQISLVTDDGRIRTVAVAHRDPVKQRLAEGFVGRTHMNPDGKFGTPHVIRTGTSECLSEVTPGTIDAVVGDPERARVYGALGVRSVIAVPLLVEDRTLGALAVFYGDSDRRYTDDDLPMLEELGRRAGLAIHRARLFEREHRAAESFQRASLPAVLPEVPRLILDAYYAPGSADAQVGGDWYDAVRLADGRVVLSVGDVAGSGLEAAVTMGNMRQIIRGIAQVHADPALMLDAADRALRLEHPDTYVTAFVCVFDPIDYTLRYASAGHPPPLLRLPDGTLADLTDRGLPLGLRTNAMRASSTTIAVPPGASLVLYTDGLTEFARDPERGESRLRALLRRGFPESERRPARRIVESVLEDAAASDDVAVLVITVAAEREDGIVQRWSFDTHDAAAASDARHAFAEAFRRRGGDIEDVAIAELVFGELTSNTVRYAPGGIDVIADWSRPEPVLHVLDRGSGFRHISILPPDLLSESGRGLFVVSALTQDFRVSMRAGGGSHARAVLRLRSRLLADADATGLSGSLLTSLAN
jgi:PAS domain S-box-containing protein